MSHLPTAHNSSYKSTSSGQKRSFATSVEDVAGYLILPSSDRNEWYYPSHPDTELDTNDLPAGIKEGNWGSKSVRSARWIRRGKKVAWSLAREEWEVEQHARKRLKTLLPTLRSPSPPSLPHLRSPSPPLTSPYPMPNSQHLCYSSFVLDQSLAHSFRSELLSDLERTTANLIEGEAALKRSLGRLWQVLSEEPNDENDSLEKVDNVEVDNEDGDDYGVKTSMRIPDISNPIYKIFLTQYDDDNQMIVEPSHLGNPQMQVESLEKSIGTLKELNEDGREYGEVLEEIREGLGGLRAQRDMAWNMVRESALKELQGITL